jgi:hypothetical protein
MAPAILNAPPTVREFVIPFKIEGKRSVWASDLEGAQRLADNIQAEEYAQYGDLQTFTPRLVSPVIRLTHFQRGQVDVQAEIADGRREWTCPNRPMMRPWEDCHFNETPDEIDERIAMATAHIFTGPTAAADPAPLTS